MKAKGIKIFFLVFIVLLMFFGILFLRNSNKKEEKTPIFHVDIEKRWWADKSELGNLIEENYWKFMRKSYIFIGSPPNYTFVKILKEVPRNNFDIENFKIDENGIQKYFDDQGNLVSKIGIDVSYFQTNINWEKVKENNVEVAIIRLGYRGYSNGKIVLDEMYENHINGALSAGLDVGVYFFTQALNYEEGVEEARFVLENIKDKNIKYPIIIDTEELFADEYRTLGQDVESRTDGVVGFCETIKEAGYTPMIYANRNWFVQNLNLSRLKEYEIWLAHYSEKPDFPYIYRAWQYTDKGRLSGIDIDLDLNLWMY